MPGERRTVNRSELHDMHVRNTRTSTVFIPCGIVFRIYGCVLLYRDNTVTGVYVTCTTVYWRNFAEQLIRIFFQN